MKFKDTLKLFKYAYQYKLMFLILMIFAFNCIMYIFTPMGVILQGLMVSVAGTYLVNYTYQTMVSGMIQGSEKVQKKILKHFTVILLVSNTALFFIFIVTKFVFIRFTSSDPKNTIAVFLLNYMTFNILTYIAVAIIFKKQLLGCIILGIEVLMVFAQFPYMISESRENWVKVFTEGLNTNTFFGGDYGSLGLLAMAFAVCLISPFIFYAVSKLMEKVPFSKAYIDRQPWGKI